MLHSITWDGEYVNTPDRLKVILENQGYDGTLDDQVLKFLNDNGYSMEAICDSWVAFVIDTGGEFNTSTAYFNDTLTVGTDGLGTWGYGNNGLFGDFAVGDVAGSWPNGLSSWRRFYFSDSAGQLRLNGAGIDGVDTLWVTVGELDPVQFNGTLGGTNFTPSPADAAVIHAHFVSVGDGNTTPVVVYTEDPNA